MMYEFLSEQRLWDEKMGRKQLGVALKRKGNYGKRSRFGATLGRTAWG